MWVIDYIEHHLRFVFVMYAACWAVYFLLEKKRAAQGMAAGLGLLSFKKFGWFSIVNWAALLVFSVVFCDQY